MEVDKINQSKPQKQPLTIAITGSAGKTTTKEMIAAILQQRWKIIKSRTNGNAPHHTRRQLQYFKDPYDAAVLEFGLNGAGSIREHCDFIQPQLAVITNIGSAHIGNYNADVRELAKQKSEIFLRMQKGGTLFVNADDPNTQHLLLRNFKRRLIKVSTKGNGQYNALDIKYGPKGMTFKVFFAGEIHILSIPAFGVHNIYNALYAISVCDLLGFTVKEIKEGLQAYEKPKRRLEIYRLKDDIVLIDDSYSANPHAVKAAVDVLYELGKTKSTIAVLGSMMQLGEYSVTGHREVGAYVSAKQIDYLLTFGEYAKPVITAALENGYPPQRAMHYEVLDELHRHLKKIIQPGTIILVKASNMMGFCQTSNFIYENFKKN